MYPSPQNTSKRISRRVFVLDNKDNFDDESDDSSETIYNKLNEVVINPHNGEYKSADGVTLFEVPLDTNIDTSTKYLKNVLVAEVRQAQMQKLLHIIIREILCFPR